MNNKKINILLSLLTLVSICSCGKTTSNKYVSLKIWTYYNGNTEASFQDIINDFNETRGKELKIAVSSQSQGKSVNDLLNALTDSASEKLGSDPMPDIFLAYPDTAYELDKLGKIASLNDYFSSEEFSNYNEGFLNEGKLPNSNEYKILPMSKSTEALYINKTDLDKFNKNYPHYAISYEELSTYEGLISASKRYFEQTGKAFFGSDSLDNYFVVGGKQLGIDILRYDENNNYGINYDKEVFKKLWECYYVPYVKGYFYSESSFRSGDIKSGNIIAYVGSTSSGGYFPSNVVISDNESYDIECKVIKAPIFSNGSDVAVSQGAGFCITKSNKEQESAAASFLKWLSEKDNIRSFSNETGYFPATNDGFSYEFIASQTNSNFKQSFTVAKNVINNSMMYTNIVGEGGTSLRNKLKTSLDILSKEARANVLKSSSQEEAIKEYTSESKFEEWFNSLTK